MNRKRGAAADAVDGHRGHLPQAETVATRARAQGFSVLPVARGNDRPHQDIQVGSTDITDVPLACGFLYLAAVIDWYSRYVLAWRLSNTSGRLVLPGHAGGGVGSGATGGVQHRPGAYNSRRRPGQVGWSSAKWGGGEHGRQRPRPGQRLRGTSLAFGEVRRPLCVAIRRASPELRRGLERYFLATTTRSVCIRRLDYRTPAGVYWEGRAAGQRAR